ncbi:hypothetical protein, partial [Geodermatophilus sp. SYSU D01180]
MASGSSRASIARAVAAVVCFQHVDQRPGAGLVQGAGGECCPGRGQVRAVRPRPVRQVGGGAPADVEDQR